jgi:exonuclease VII large subunit
VKREDDGKVVMRATDLKSGDDIRAHLASGELIATVKKVLADE